MDSTSVHTFWPAISDTVYGLILLCWKKYGNVPPTLCGTGYFSADRRETGCSFASMTLCHITNNDVTTFINKERRETRKLQPPCTQDQTRPSFCAAAAASNVGKLKKGRTPNSLERFTYNLECLATDEIVSSHKRSTHKSFTVPKHFLKSFP